MTVLRMLNGAEDVNQWLRQESPWQVLSSATGINDLGEISGVGTRNDDSVPHAYLMSPLTAPPLFASEQRLTMPNNDARLGVGTTVAFDGRTLVIGSPEDGQLGDAAGAAFVYQREGKEWVFQAKLLASEGEPGGRFGRAVAVAGDRIAVTSHGWVYVYTLTGTGWALATPRFRGNDAVYGSFGAAVALEEDTLVVARTGLTSSISGTVYVFDFVDGLWRQSFKFGFWSGSKRVTLALEGDNLIVGEPDNGDGLVNSYHRDEDEFVHQSTLLQVSQVNITGEVGAALDMDGGTLVIGDPGAAFQRSDGTTIEDAGIVYVFELRDGQWVQHALLHSSGREDSRIVHPLEPLTVGERFGQSVAVDGDLIAVGASGGNEGAHGAGTVYIFQRQGSQWVEEVKLTVADSRVNQQLGRAVALSGGMLVAGAPRREDGAVYSYALANSPDSADLQLAISVDRSAVGVGESITATLTVTNLSDVVATGVVVTLLLPAEFAVAAMPDGCTLDGGVLSCRIGVVGAGASEAIDVVAEPLTERTVTYRAWVSAYQHDSDQHNNETALAIRVDAAPPPRVLPDPLGDGSGTIVMTPHDRLELTFEVENWSLEPSGRHVHWQLDGVVQDDVYTTSIDLSGIDEGDHVVTLNLADADHGEVSTPVSVAFSIERPRWPTVNITAPADGATLTLPIQLRYTLDFGDLATAPQDFLLALDDGPLDVLADGAEQVFDNLASGRHTIQIRYKESAQADATVTVFVRGDDEPAVTDDESERGGGTAQSGAGGGGRLEWLIVIVLALLAYKRWRVR